MATIGGRFGFPQALQPIVKPGIDNEKVFALMFKTKKEV
jgi:hypothetical protein